MINTLTDVDGPPVFEQDFEPDEGMLTFPTEVTIVVAVIFVHHGF